MIIDEMYVIGKMAEIAGEIEGDVVGYFTEECYLSFKWDNLSFQYITPMAYNESVKTGVVKEVSMEEEIFSYLKDDSEHFEDAAMKLAKDLRALAEKIEGVYKD